MTRIMNNALDLGAPPGEKDPPVRAPRWPPPARGRDSAAERPASGARRSARESIFVLVL